MARLTLVFFLLLFAFKSSNAEGLFTGSVSFDCTSSNVSVVQQYNDVVATTTAADTACTLVTSNPPACGTGETDLTKCPYITASAVINCNSVEGDTPYNWHLFCPANVSDTCAAGSTLQSASSVVDGVVTLGVCGCVPGLVLSPDGTSCETEPDPIDDPLDRSCNPETGVGCSTADKQDQEKAALDKIKQAIDAGNLKLTAIEGILQRSDGTYTDMKTLLTQIANSDGVKFAGGAGGLSQSQTSDAVKEGIEEGFNINLSRVGQGSFTDERLQLESDIAAKKVQLTELTDSIKGHITGLVSADSPTGGGGLPCFGDISPLPNATFNICLSDYEDELSMVPLFFVGTSFIFAGLILIRPRV